MPNPKKQSFEALLAGAVEAAEIVSQRAISDEADRLHDDVRAVGKRTGKLEESVAQLRDVMQAISQGYGSLSKALQRDIRAALSDIEAQSKQSATRSADESSTATADALGKHIDGCLADLSNRLIGYVDERHGVAVAAQKDAQALVFDELRQKLKVALEEQRQEQIEGFEGYVETLKDRVEGHLDGSVTALRSVARDVTEKAEKAAQEAHEASGEARAVAALADAARDDLSAVANSLTTDVIESVGEVKAGAEEILIRAEETVEKQLAEARSEVFLYTEKAVEDMLGTVQDTLAEIEVPAGDPGPPGPEGPPGEKGDPGQDGVLTRVEVWHPERDWTRRAVVMHAGGIWQCRSETDEEPGFSVHWACLVNGIRKLEQVGGALFVRYSDQSEADLGSIQGPPGKTPRLRGTYDEGRSYEFLDVVILRGTSYAAKIDNPGTCPGRDWQMIAQAKAGPAGKPGRRGPEGKAGPPGPVGPPGQGWRWRGKYDIGSTYLQGDVVNYSYALWIALVETTAEPKADQENWDLVLRDRSGGGGSGGGGLPTTDEKVGVTSSDGSPGYLDGKMQSGDGSVVFTVLNPGGSEILDLQATGAGGGQANVGSNVGGGVEVYKGMNGVALELRTLAATSTVVPSQNVDVLELDVPAGTFDAFGAAATVQTDLDGHKTGGDHDSRYDAAGTAAAGDSAHTSAFDHADIPTAAQKAALDANFLLTAGNPVAGHNDDEVKQLKVSSADTTPNFLLDKLFSGDGSVTLTKTNPGGDETVDIRAVGTGPTTFLGLTDTPPDYTGQQGQLVAVNATEDGLIYVAPSGTSVSWGAITGTLSAQTDLQTELDAKLGDAPSNGNNYLRRDGAWEISPVTPIGGLATEYTWDANTSASSPAVGGVKANNVNHPSATAIYIHATTGNGNDASSAWSALQAGDYLGIWEDQSDREGIYYSVTGPAVNNGGWFTIPVAVLPGWLGGMDDGQTVTVFPILDPTNKLALGGTAGQAYVKQSGANYAADWVTLTAADVGAEPAFAKNSGFNLPLGSTLGTVAAGDDARFGAPVTPLAHAASHAAGQSDEITPAAINAVPTSRAINTTGGIQGGGDGTQDRTHSLTDTGVTPAAYTNADITVDAKGRITAAANGSGGTTLHANLTDLATSGHPGSVIIIPAGVQGNAVSIAADGSLQDSGVPPGGAGGTTDLSNTPSAIEVTIESSSGQDTSVVAATTSLAGVMSASDKTKLDGIQTGAEVNAVDSVAGSNSITASPTTGAVVVGLQGDAASPGNSQYYGTDGAGTKGFHALPAGATNLSNTPSANEVTIESDTGTDTSVVSFSDTLAGVVPGSGGGTSNFLRADGAWAAPPAGGGGTGEAVVWTVTQVGHPFTQVGQPIYSADGATWQGAQADTAATIHTAVVAENTGANEFKAQQSGILNGITFATLTPGSYYYLADNGSLSTTPGTFDAPVLFALTASSALILPFRAGSGATGGPGPDILLDGYTEQGDSSTLNTSGTITVPMDGRIYEVTLTGAATLAFGTKPTPPVTASTIVMVKSAGNALTLPATTYWPGGTEVTVGGAGTITRYVMSVSPTGDQIMDGEVLSIP